MKFNSKKWVAESVGRKLYGSVPEVNNTPSALAKRPTRDEIATQFFGSRFSSLSSERKEFVTKTWSVIKNSAIDSDHAYLMLSKAANQAAVDLVKQLKEIGTNSGDPIKLSEGVINDAAKVLKLHYQASHGSPLSKLEITDIRREIKRKFGDVNPKVADIIIGHISNPKGRFSGVDLATLRKKLGSYIEPEQLEDLKDQEILSTRDIAISHLFDKWTGGNLSSLIIPKFKDLQLAEYKELEKSEKLPEIEFQDIKRVLQSLKEIEILQSNPKLLNHPIHRKALENLGISVDQIVGWDAKEAVANIRNAVYDSLSQERPGLKTRKYGGGVGARGRRNFDIYPAKRPQDSTINKIVKTGIGKATRLNLVPSTTVFGSKDPVIPIRIKKDPKIDYEGNVINDSRAAGSVSNFYDATNYASEIENAIEETIDADKAYGYVPRIAYTTLRHIYDSPPLGSLMTGVPHRVHGGVTLDTVDESETIFKDLEFVWLEIEAGIKKRQEEYEIEYTRAIHQPIFASTDREERSPLAKIANQFDYEDTYGYLEKLDDYQAEFGSFGKDILDYNVPLNEARKAQRIDKATLRKYINTFKPAARFERDLEIQNPYEYRAFNPFEEIDQIQSEIGEGHPIYEAVQTFLSKYPQFSDPSALAQKGSEIEEVIDMVAAGYEGPEAPAPGEVRRVGVVGSKSFEHKAFIYAWLKKNFRPHDLMISSAAVGKLHESSGILEHESYLGEGVTDYDGPIGPSNATHTPMLEGPINVGASFHASNWAHWNYILEKKIKVSKDKYGKDATVKNVIDSSDEVIAFFEKNIPNSSMVSEINKISKSIGDKPLRIVWFPEDLTIPPEDQLSKSERKITFDDRLVAAGLTNKPNVSIERYRPPVTRGATNALFNSEHYSPWNTSLKGLKLIPPWTDSELPAIPRLYKPLPMRTIKKFQHGGKLNSHEMAIVGEAGPELLMPSGSGGFNVIANKHIRMLEAGTFTPNKDVIVATGATDQPDDHFYRTPEGRVIPSVSNVVRFRTKESQDKAAGLDHIDPWYSDIGTEIHRRVALQLARDAKWADTARFETETNWAKHASDRNPAGTATYKYPQTYDKLSEFIENGVTGLISELKGLGFQVTAIEERFVDLNHEFSGTLDLLGTINGTPTLIDLKTKGTGSYKKFEENHRLQLGAYASFFDEESRPELMQILSVARENGAVASPIKYGPKEIESSISAFYDALMSFNHRFTAGDLNNIPALAPLFGVPTGKPVGYSTEDEDAAAWRLNTLEATKVDFYDVLKKTQYPRSLKTTVHNDDLSTGNVALGKTLPAFEEVGSTPDETWDKNPSRLRLFGARLNEIGASMGGPGVHPIISDSIKELLSARLDIDRLNLLANMPVGSVEEDPQTLEVFNKIYQTLKPISFNQKLLNTGKNMDYTLWEDARTLVNILEEAAKSYASVPRLPHMTYSPPSSSTGVPGKVSSGSKSARAVPLSGSPADFLVPGHWSNGIDPSTVKFPSPGIATASGSPASSYVPPALPMASMAMPSKSAGVKCKGVDLCQSTMARFETWFSALRSSLSSNAVASAVTSTPAGSSRSGGQSNGPNPEKDFADDYLGTIDHPTGWRKYLEHLPIVGMPLKMHRQQQVYHQRILQADTENADEYAPKGYWKLLEKEEQARNKYYRSIRGATTSFLIAQHVMRVFGQTSMVYAKGAEAVGKGFGYIVDMFLLPALQFVSPVVNGLVGIGNWMRSAPALLGVGIATLGYVGYKTLDWINSIKLIPNTIDRAAAGIDKLVNKIDEFGDKIVEMVNYARFDYKPYNPEEGEDIYFTQPFAGHEIPEGYEIKSHSKGIFNVLGTGNKDTELALLTPGEMVLPKHIAKSIRGYADGGIVGGASNLMSAGIGAMTSGFTALATSDAGSAALAGLGTMSRVVSSIMAPMAPAIAGGVIAGKGFTMIKNSIARLQSSNQSIMGSGFGSLRTMIGAELAPILTTAGAVVGIYNLLAGLQPVFDNFKFPEIKLPELKLPEFDLPKIMTDAWDFIKLKASEIWDAIKLKALETWESAKIKAFEIWESIKTNAKEFWDKLPDRFTDLTGKIVDRLISGKDFVTDFIGRLIKPGVDFIDLILERIGLKTPKAFGPQPQTLTSKAVDVITNAGKTAVEGGYLPTATLVTANEVFKGNATPESVAKAAIPAIAGQWVFNKIAEILPAGAGGLLSGAGGFLANPFFKDLGANAEQFTRRTLGMEESDNPWLSRMASQTAGSMLNFPVTVGATASEWVNNLGEVADKFSKGETPWITGENQGLTGQAMKDMWNTYGNIMNVAKGGNYETGHSAPFDYIYSAGQSLNPANPSAGTGVIESLLAEIKALLKQPTINQNSFEFKSDDEYQLMTKISQALANQANSSGAQRTG